MTELEILSAVKNNDGSIEYTALLNQGMTDINRDPLADKARIQQMIDNGLLEGQTSAYASIRITTTGRRFLQDSYYLEDQNKKLAEETAKNKSKENRHDWRLAIVGAFISGLIGLVFELFAFLFLK